MKLQQIEDGIFVSAQITVANIKTLAKTGIKTIVCNRPDQEEPNQPDFATIQAVAHKYGIQAHYIPITPSIIEKSHIKAMQTILKTAPLPLLAYCCYGTRSIHLYSLARI